MSERREILFRGKAIDSPDIARFEMSGDGLVVDFDNFYPHEFEIAGNIHDNPELLEESQ